MNTLLPAHIGLLIAALSGCLAYAKLADYEAQAGEDVQAILSKVNVWALGIMALGAALSIAADLLG